MTYATDHGFDDEEMGLGRWMSDETEATYRCPACGCVWHAKEWHWYGATRSSFWGPPMPEITCGECDAPLSDADIVDGSGCGDCGKDVVEPGTDYCRACNAAHDAAEQVDPLHHHVWQSTSDFESTVREITRAQAVRS